MNDLAYEELSNQQRCLCPQRQGCHPCVRCPVPPNTVPSSRGRALRDRTWLLSEVVPNCRRVGLELRMQERSTGISSYSRSTRKCLYWVLSQKVASQHHQEHQRTTV